MSDLLDRLFTKPPMIPVLNYEKECPWRDKCDQKQCILGTLLLAGIPAFAG